MDKENRVAVITFRKCGIERARIFELLKPLNITRVFVYRTVKLLLDTGGEETAKDPVGLALFVHHRLLIC